MEGFIFIKGKGSTIASRAEMKKNLSRVILWLALGKNYPARDVCIGYQSQFVSVIF